MRFKGFSAEHEYATKALLSESERS